MPIIDYCNGGVFKIVKTIIPNQEELSRFDNAIKDIFNIHKDRGITRVSMSSDSSFKIEIEMLAEEEDIDIDYQQAKYNLQMGITMLCRKFEEDYPNSDFVCRFERKDI